MRKAQKQEVLDFIESLQQAHEEIKEILEQKNYVIAQNMLDECQQYAISLGEVIEAFEGKGHVTVSYIEEYCELLFRVYEGISGQEGNIINGNKIYKMLRKQLVKVKNSVRVDIVVRKEIVFFPYKVSMWDSMESIYLAAKKDLSCDVYCVPVPYYDLNPDQSFGLMHYEGYEYPDGIEIIDWQNYNLEERNPDVIYTHCPYDNWNLVTSIHPRYYTSNLKKYTDCLVYTPYYSTAGGMAEGQCFCPAYLNVDYIIIQTPKFKNYFDKRVSEKKFLPLGSPKFDKIIAKCQNPPEPPIEWKKKMDKRKVYFYNTSIQGMLGDTEAFLKKMRYVFDIFRDRCDVCLLWRPHPLLESTFDSMRVEYKRVYEELKRYYIEKDIGIYDTNPDMTNSIAWSDAYIGDSASSLTSLFGIVGKPLFILNNQIHSKPMEDSWRGEIIPGSMFNYFEQDRFAITQGNKLYISEPQKYDYKYFCDLSEDTYGGYYSTVHEIDGVLYVCPQNAEDILILDEKGIAKRILLEKKLENQGGAFCGARKYGKYLLLLPLKYSALVRYNTENGDITYLVDHLNVFLKKNDRDETVVGCSYIYEGALYITSPTDNYMYRLDIKSGKSQVIELHTQNKGGYCSLVEIQGLMWMMPYKGQNVLCWNPKTGETKEYTGFPEGFQCIHPTLQIQTDEYPLGGWFRKGEEMYFMPLWGNMCLRLDLVTGVFSECSLPISYEEGKEYFYSKEKSLLIPKSKEKNEFMLFHWAERKLYDFDIESYECREIEIKFDKSELQLHTDGFCDSSKWLKYCCHENSFNTLEDFLKGSITGRPHDVELQKKSFGEIAVNNDGSCGCKVHEFIVSL